MKVTPTRHGKFEKHIYTLCVLLPSLHFMHYRSQPSCGSKNQILSQVSIISEVIKTSLNFHDFVLRFTVSELHLHCNTFYQGYLVMKHRTEEDFSVSQQVCNVALNKSNQVFTALHFRMDILYDSRTYQSSSGLSCNCQYEVMTLHTISCLILEVVMLQQIFMICLVTQVTFLRWHQRL